MVGTNCSVDGCWGSKEKKHRFPNPKKYMLLFKKWVALCQNKRLKEKSPEKVYNNCRVCSIHFETSDFGPNKTIKRTAFPKLNMPGCEQELIKEDPPSSPEPFIESGATRKYSKNSKTSDKTFLEEIPVDANLVELIKVEPPSDPESFMESGSAPEYSKNTKTSDETGLEEIPVDAVFFQLIEHVDSQKRKYNSHKPKFSEENQKSPKLMSKAEKLLNEYFLPIKTIFETDILELKKSMQNISDALEEQKSATQEAMEEIIRLNEENTILKTRIDMLEMKINAQNDKS
ncbi:unnamed protein product [Brassicogethes aeneus]|uniref:THAP-type domain-containing protein n=1 Tax=Brassicogethes aeneus TaxID=1431903 RepID=A0A9P0ATM0_BRAAE|nr:unnamed protein product [Brassicogethes aeneus]